MSWSKAVFFEPDERLIHEFKLGAKMSLDSGVVVVTNDRILVIQNQGKAIRNYKLLAETHLEHVSGISEEGIVNKKITVKTTESPTGKFWFYMSSDTALFQQIVNHPETDSITTSTVPSVARQHLHGDSKSRESASPQVSLVQASDSRGGGEVCKLRRSRLSFHFWIALPRVDQVEDCPKDPDTLNHAKIFA